MDYTPTDPVTVLSKYREVRLREEKERDIWKKCFEYVNSRVDGELGQWKQEIRKQLTAEGRPPISFNIIKKFVNRICGAQSLAKMDERAFPRDDQSDPMVGDVLTDLLKYVKDINDAEVAISRMFRDGIITGRGFIKTEWSNENDPMGEIIIKAINPFRVYLIGDGDEYDISKDRKMVIEEIPMDKDEMLARFPDKAEDIETLQAEMDRWEDGKDPVPTARTYDYGFGLSVPYEYVFDKSDKKMKVLRCQKMVRTKVPFFKNLQTNELIQAPDKKTDRKLALQLATQAGHQLEEISQSVKSINVSYSIGSILLEDAQSPYKLGQYDITAFFCYNDNGYITGVVQDLLDPQDEKNKRRSQAIHLMGTAAKNSYFVRKGSVDDINKSRTEMGKVGSLVEVNGNPRDAMIPIESNTTAIPALLQLEMQSEADTKSISGINDASLGIVPQGVKSGRGITALQQPSETIVGEMYAHLLSSRKMIFRKVLALIQQFYTEERRIRILGDYSQNVVPPQVAQMKDQLKVQIFSSNPSLSEEEVIMQADNMIQMMNGAKVITINKQILGKKLNDVSVGRFDVVLDEVSQSATMRQQQYNDMLNMRALGIPISNEAIIEASDIRNKQKVLQDLQATEQKMMMQQLMMQKPQQHATPPKSPQPADEMANSGGAQF